MESRRNSKNIVSIRQAHTIPFDDFEREVFNKAHSVISFSKIEYKFRDTIDRLKRTHLASRDMLPLFIKYFGLLEIPQIPEEERRFIRQLEEVNDLVSLQIGRYGLTAYTMLYVIIEYLSKHHRVFLSSGPTELGEWINDFIQESKSEDFSISAYIGNKAYDVASWFELRQRR